MAFVRLACCRQRVRPGFLRKVSFFFCSPLSNEESSRHDWNNNKYILFEQGLHPTRTSLRWACAHRACAQRDPQRDASVRPALASESTRARARTPSLRGPGAAGRGVAAAEGAKALAELLKQRLQRLQTCATIANMRTRVAPNVRACRWRAGCAARAAASKSRGVAKGGATLVTGPWFVLLGSDIKFLW